MNNTNFDYRNNNSNSQNNFGNSNKKLNIQNSLKIKKYRKWAVIYFVLSVFLFAVGLSLILVLIPTFQLLSSGNPDGNIILSPLGQIILYSSGGVFGVFLITILLTIIFFSKKNILFKQNNKVVTKEFTRKLDDTKTVNENQLNVSSQAAPRPMGQNPNMGPRPMGQNPNMGPRPMGQNPNMGPRQNNY